jgi:G:T/U-mismatch repair DNA glycosylase
MNYRTLNPYREEILPWSEYIPNNADKLILGTFPTKENNRDFEFFYPNRNNKFWKVLARIANKKLTDFENNADGKLLAVGERKRILDKLNLAITDIGAKILRQKNSSLDSNLFPIEFTNIFSIVDKHPKIKTIILTSSSKGNSVLSWFAVYCSINNVNLKIEKNDKDFPKTTEITIDNKKVKIVIVNSTSGAACKTEDFLVNQYGEVIKQK